MRQIFLADTLIPSITISGNLFKIHSFLWKENLTFPSKNININRFHIDEAINAKFCYFSIKVLICPV